MSFVYKIKKDKQKIIPAVTHVDGTGRLQTVSRNINKKYYDLIKEFNQNTSVPILLNTSFNENEPIVESPSNAIDTFLKTQMDVLVLENYVISKINFHENYFLNKLVLEIGCNQGLTTLQICKFAKKVTAIDNNENHIYLAKKLKLKNIEYLQCDMLNEKAIFKLGKFEVIYLREIFNFLKINDKRKLLEF